MGYVSDYEEFRQSDARDAELRQEMRRDRAEEMGYPMTAMRPEIPAAIRERQERFVAESREATRQRLVERDVRRIGGDCEICAYCGETARRCECWA
jgi:hypothetical protein